MKLSNKIVIGLGALLLSVGVTNANLTNDKNQFAKKDLPYEYSIKQVAKDLPYEYYEYSVKQVAKDLPYEYSVKQVAKDLPYEYSVKQVAKDLPYEYRITSDKA